MKVAVLGGSSPFTAALVDALVPRLDELPRAELALHGRDVDRLALIGESARFRLAAYDWTVLATADAAAALREATIVIHQVRYGGMALRREGERLCEAVHCHADETLGPAALLTALRLREPVARMCESIQTHAPHAVVLNLTNPLSVVTSWMHRQGVRGILGVCELPLVTARQVAERLQVMPARLEWSYTGLNHRGFLHHLSVDGLDLLAQLVERLGDGDVAGVPAKAIAALGAVPTKYFRLLIQPPEAASPSRAEYLESLQAAVAAELRADPRATPPSLRQRYLDWYPHAVVPLLAALASEQPRREVVNVVEADGITRERIGMVSRKGIAEIAAPPAPPTTRDWLDRFERHERTLLDGFDRPTRDWLHAALACDPLGGDSADEIADAVWSVYQYGPVHSE